MLPAYGRLVKADPLAFAQQVKRPSGGGWDRLGALVLGVWRTASGTEVDLVVETGGRLVPIEVKLSATPRPPMAAGIRTFQQMFGDRATGGYMVHPGDIRLPLAPGVIAVPFAEL